MYHVEAGIEMPESGVKEVKYPFKEMDIGDSFFVSFEVGGDGLVRRMHSTAYNYGKRLGRKFLARKVEGGVRIWRME